MDWTTTGSSLWLLLFCGCLDDAVVSSVMGDDTAIKLEHMRTSAFFLDLEQFELSLLRLIDP